MMLIKMLLNLIKENKGLLLVICSVLLIFIVIHYNSGNNIPNKEIIEMVNRQEETLNIILDRVDEVEEINIREKEIIKKEDDKYDRLYKTLLNKYN